MDFKEKYRQMNERIVPSPAVIRALAELPVRSRKRIGRIRGMVPAAACVCLVLALVGGSGIPAVWTKVFSSSFSNDQAAPPYAGVKANGARPERPEEGFAAQDQGSLETIKLLDGILYLNRRQASDSAENEEIGQEMDGGMKTIEEAGRILGIPEGMLSPDVPADLQAVREDGLWPVQEELSLKRLELSYQGKEGRSAIIRLTSGDSAEKTLRDRGGADSLIQGILVWAFYEPGIAEGLGQYSAEFADGNIACRIETKNLTRTEFTALLESLLVSR